MKAIPATLTALVATVVASACFAANGQADPVYTNNSRFRIPFRYDVAEMASLGAKEVQLFVSTDRGSQWQIAGRALPELGRFEFQAPSDGEYWFSVRTLDGSNQLQPPGDFKPGLVVNVDTTQPTLELELREITSGQVELKWNADDRHIDPLSIEIEMRRAGETEWTRIATGSQLAGNTTFDIPEGGIVAVHGTARDLAKNTVIAESQLRIPAAGQQQTEPSDPDLSQPIANNSATPNSRKGTRSANQKPIISPRSTQGRYVSDQADSRPQIVQPRYPQPKQQEQAQQPAPAQRKQESTPAEQVGDNRTRIVNSLGFQIGYQVDDVGPSGVSSVDLFITPDDGKKWYRYGSDPDNASPFRVEVPRDGIYGFALRVRSGVGLVAAPPRPGDKPSIVVVADTTPPVVELIPAEQGQGQELNQVVINWKIEDANPAAKPVAVYYSRGAQGPWEPISGWQEDTGGYSWTLGQNMPPRFYVRVAARDAAGNVTEVDAENPVVVDMTRPSARIVDVETLEAR